jgi:hypothetical protein
VTLTGRLIEMIFSTASNFAADDVQSLTPSARTSSGTGIFQTWSFDSSGHMLEVVLVSELMPSLPSKSAKEWLDKSLGPSE